jgi:lipid A disaccharide synthetase
MLKRMDLDKKMLANIVEDIYAVDEIINNTYQYSTIFNKLSNLVFTSNRNANNSIKEQQLLESLASNDLFIKSAELKTI